MALTPAASRCVGVSRRLAFLGPSTRGAGFTAVSSFLRRPGVITMQALSEEDRRLWMEAMDGREPVSNRSGTSIKSKGPAWFVASLGRRLLLLLQVKLWALRTFKPSWAHVYGY